MSAARSDSPKCGSFRREIRILNTTGVAGHVFTTGQGAIVHDAYADPRFNRREVGRPGFQHEQPFGGVFDRAFPSIDRADRPNDVAAGDEPLLDQRADDARTLVANGCVAVSEGANMPTDLEGVHVFKEAKLLYAPGKASNAGGVAVSGLEMSQNSARISWKEEQLQQLLKDIMLGIHESCREYGQRGDYIDYVKGANIAGFKKVADAMLAFGVV